MRNKLVRAWLGAGGVLLAFSSLAWTLPRLFGIDGARAWVLRGGLLVFGTVAAALVLVLLLRRARSAPQTAGDEDIDAAIAAAESRLAASRQTPESRIGRLPLALVLGPAGSTKTTVITHSGLDPELLAGEVTRGDAVVPTEPLNAWYAHGSILLEAGGRLLEDADRWRSLVRHLQPHRLAAAVGRGRQAPRIAIVCFPCDEILRPGASQSLAVAARTLRARLTEASQQLGIRLPVYVLFTRADRIPFFAEYVRNLAGAEAHQPIGATLPYAAESDGTWAERESRRLNDAFGRIVHALSIRRLDLLQREAAEQARAGAYEFPRELRKMAEPAVQLLLDIFRPSQLGVAPFLRGFYFTGVRPVIVRDAAIDFDVPQPGTQPQAGATSVFNPAMLRQQAAAVPQPGGGGRKVPQWVFVQRLFRDVLLRDDVARRITGGGTRVDLLRRGLIASAAAACLVFALGFTFSFFGNRSLIRGAVAAAAEAREIGAMPGTPAEEELARLDALREQTARVTRYARNGHPFRLGWGLYTGAAIQPVLHRMYFQRFEQALWADTRERLTQYLRELPPRPDENSDFGRAQDALAAHLLTTSQYERSTGDQLAPTLLSFTPAASASDSALARAHRQFEFFGDELAYGNPYDTQPDAPLVERSQDFLRSFGMEAYYRALVYDANSRVPAVRFIGSGDVVTNDAVVPGAFTLAGRDLVQANLDSVDDLFVRYQWIYGNQPPANKPQRADLARLYEQEYIRRWQDYIARGAVQRFANMGEAGGRLGLLAGTTSPLFAMLAVASRETAMDTLSAVGRAFQPLHATVAPDADPRAVTAGVLGYANALNGLSAQLNVLAGASGPAREQGAMQAAAAAAAIRSEAATLAASFVMSGEAAITASNIQRLLRQPADQVETLISGMGVAALNEAAASFCRSFAGIAGRYPFAAGGQDASVDDVSAMFQRNGGVLWTFYQDVLQPLMNEQGRPRPGQRVRSDYERFFRAAAEFSNAVYGTGPTPIIGFGFQPVIPAGAAQVVLEAGGATYTYTPTDRRTRTVEWHADRHREARLVAVYGSDRVVVAQAEGPWAIFRLFQNAAWTSASAPFRVEWRIPGRDGNLTSSVSFEAGVPPILRRGHLDPLAQCVRAIQ